MKGKKILALALAAGCAFGSLGMFAGCGGKGSGRKGDAYELTVYRARDTGMTDGDRDDEVKKAIEDKFYADTGVKILLNLQLYPNDTGIIDIVDVNFNNKNKNIDGIMHYLSEDSGSAITKYAKDARATMDIDPLLETHGKNILKYIQMNDEGHLADRAGYFPIGDGKYSRKALTGVTRESGFGLLMRKDLMKAVQDKTGLDPEDYDIANGNYKSMTVSEFETVMREIKNDTNNDITIPVNGKPWDLGRVVATAYGVDCMTGYGKDENGKYVPSQFTPGWDKYVDLMYRWSNEGIWESESNNTTDDQRLTNLIADKSAAYLAYPTAEQLISVSKRFYAAHSGNEELMVIAPFASEDADGKALLNDSGEQIINGNLKTARGFYGMIIPYRAKNAEILIQYIDWMYSSVENYELCQYGVKGVDWLEGDPVVYNGKEYQTWVYPDDKKDEYLLKPPYTGKFTLLRNINISDRISGHYNTVEKKWYAACYFQFPTYGNTELEGIWLPETPRSHASAAADLDGDYVENIRSYAWVGRKNNGKTPTQLLTEYVAEKRASASGYLEYVDTQYRQAITYMNNKYAD